MSPGVIARAADDWRNAPAGHEIANLQFESPVLTRASDARFDWFVRQFLENVTIPEELIRFTQGCYERHVSAQAADWLRGFKFTGGIKFDPSEAPRTPGCNVLVVVSAPICETRLIWSPMQMLVELLSVKAEYWKRAARIAKPDEVHHMPIGEWPFEPWIDLHVARACGFPAIGRSGVISSMNRINNVRGHVSIVGKLPKDATELAAFAVAASLHPKLHSGAYELYQALKRT
jgi:hypothetical protein